MSHSLKSFSSRRTATFAAPLLALAALLPISAQAQLEPRPSPPGAQAYFISPANGQTVSNPVLVRFGLKGMGIAPAGIDMPNTGHHHVIVDKPQPPAGMPIPTDEHHLHFGGGQTEASITLPPGKHTLQLVLGDFVHSLHKPPVVSERITITVK